LKLTKTDYALVLNPDIICEKKFFINLSQILKSKIRFNILGCQYLNDKLYMPAGYFDTKINNNFRKKFFKKKINTLTKVEWVTGCSMIINLKEFKKKEIFDKNFFLYFEEFDLCKSVINNGGSVYTARNLKVHHLGFKSSLGKNLIEKKNALNVKDWHWMWSSFYFYKKHYGYFFALLKMSRKFLSALIKSIFYYLTKNSEKNKIYFSRLSGLTSSILMKKSWYRPKID